MSLLDLFKTRNHYLDDDSLPLLRPDVKVYWQDGIYIHKNWSCTGVTKQFLEDANTYHELYWNRLDFQALSSPGGGYQDRPFEQAT